MNHHFLQFGGRHPSLNLRARKQKSLTCTQHTPTSCGSAPNPQTPGYLTGTQAGCVTWAVDSTLQSLSVLICEGSLEPSLADGAGGRGAAQGSF